MSNTGENSDVIERTPIETPTGVGAWWKTFPDPAATMGKEGTEWRVESTSVEEIHENEMKQPRRPGRIKRLGRVVKGFFKTWMESEQQISQTLPPLLRKATSSFPCTHGRQGIANLPPPRTLTMHHAWTFEYDRGFGKAELNVDKTGGVGLATGSGEGDMTGVIIRDFAETRDAKSTIREALED